MNSQKTDFESQEQTPISLLEALGKVTENEIDQDAWSRLVEMWTKPILGYCKRRGLSREDTDDVTQIVMTRILNGIRNFQRDGKKNKFRYWVSTILRNAVIDFCNRNADQPVAQGGSDYRTVLNNVQFDNAAASKDSRPDPKNDNSAIKILGIDHQSKEDTIDCFSDIEIVQQALALLKKQWKDQANWQAFELVEFYGYSSKEAGLKIGKSDGSVRIAVKRIRDRLKQELDGMLSFHLDDEIQLTQSRQINEYYPVVYLDEAKVSICQDDVSYESSICLACGTTAEGNNELLGLWVTPESGVESRSSIINELRNRGLARFGVACVNKDSFFNEALSREDSEVPVSHLIHSLGTGNEFLNSVSLILRAESQDAAKDCFKQMLESVASCTPTGPADFESLWPDFEDLLRSTDEIKSGFLNALNIESLPSILKRGMGKRIAFSSDESALKFAFLAIKLGDDFSSHLHESIC